MIATSIVEEIWQTLRETDRIVKETALQMKETDRKMEETSRQMRETDQRMKETDRLVKENSRQLGGLMGKWGQFVENMVAPGCVALFEARGIPVSQVSQRVKARLADGRNMEVDILVINHTVAVLVEVKSTLTVEDVRDHLKRLGMFKAFFPLYQDKRVMGAVAGITSEGDAEEFARKHGLFVIVQSGDAVRLDNPPEFEPAVW